MVLWCNVSCPIFEPVFRVLFAFLFTDAVYLFLLRIIFYSLIFTGTSLGYKVVEIDSRLQ